MHEFSMARKYAIKDDKRTFVLGAVAKRRDGTYVFSRNIPTCMKNPACHAEHRITRKLDLGAVVWVVRVSRTDGSLKNSRPCRQCETAMRMAGVSRCIYSINETEYGVIHFT